jgi:endonuclease G, mitochondrial
MSDLGDDLVVGLDPIDALQQRSLDRLAAARRRPYYDADADALDRDRYYSSVDLAADDPASIAALSRLVTSTHERLLPYKPSEELYPWVDLHQDGHLRNIYSGSRVDPETVIRDDARIAKARRDLVADFVRSRATFGAREVHEEAKNVEHKLHFNCEHVVPQSWFDGDLPMRGDLHHLFTCEPVCNSDRGNLPYAELTELRTPVAGCGRRKAKQAFEPFTGKGPAARATLYFLLRYPGVIGDDREELQRAALPTLTSWHGADPISEYERHRNAAIREAQGNRNPFIDFPELTARLNLSSDFGTPVDLTRTP